MKILQFSRRLTFQALRIQPKPKTAQSAWILSRIYFLCPISGGHPISNKGTGILDLKKPENQGSLLESVCLPLKRTLTTLIVLDTWCKFDVKQVDRNAGFTWYSIHVFARWIPSTNQTVILALNLASPVKERVLKTLMNRDPTWLSDPFWVHALLVEQVARAQEPSVWAIRDHVRGLETEGKPEGRPQPDYRRLHDIARHAIHVSETLDVAVQNLEHMVMQHESYMNTNPENITFVYEDIHLHLRSFQSFIANLRFRSMSNEKRLQNEIQLAFNTVAQHDASVTLEIGRATQLDSATMKTIAFVTLTFLPPTFICAIFSMSFFDFGGDSGWSMSSQFWIYWVFAIPTTLVTTLVWTYWPDICRILFLKTG
ncbi:uncharacterized protein N7529_011528 [Penicillium soppii]|uniref:uncharacterized protein n=1 Tax=Penicillium soppii TaxID=69789 RepID=UPI002549BFC5|nr:uncharacterized protein N7529_011528 [Penicillium soppii]KAJ5852143.1 hypothetical protein N7529_011528 [Penicillium soppii]